MAWWQEWLAGVGSGAALLLLGAIANWVRKCYQRAVSMDINVRIMRQGLQRLRLRQRRLKLRVDDAEETIGDQAEQLADHDGRISHLETKDGERWPS